MTYKKRTDDRLTNAATIVRREWIESAIQSVRARLDDPLPVPQAADFQGLTAPAGEDARESSGPHLALVWSVDERRSGT